MTAPLADVTIPAIEQFGAGPWATLQLDDLGARVIKIEDPRSGGDIARSMHPGQSGEDSPYFETFRARRDGEGCDCDLSLHETAHSLLTYIGTWQATLGVEPVRHANSAQQTIVPFQNLPTSDGQIAIACAKQHFWERFARAIGRDDLLADARYAGFGGRDEHHEALLAELATTMRSRTTGEWLAVLEPAGVPCAPINDVAAALRDPQLEARGGLVGYEHPTLGLRARGAFGDAV